MCRKLFIKIGKWLMTNLYVQKDTAIKIIEEMDADGDGRISLGEFIASVENIIKGVR